MLELSILNLLYLVLIFFTTIIGTLLIIVLFRILKILGPVVEMVTIYNKIKQLISLYSQIPQIIKEKVMGIVRKDKEEKKEK